MRISVTRLDSESSERSLSLNDPTAFFDVDMETTKSSCSEIEIPGPLPPKVVAPALLARTKCLAAYLSGLRASGRVGFLFAIPLRKIDGRLNRQWPDCKMVYANGQSETLSYLLTDPTNLDLIFTGSLQYDDLEVTLQPLDGSDRDGPYRIPALDSETKCVSLRDGQLDLTGESVIGCEIELRFSEVPERNAKVLAYWQEMSGQWVHIPLSDAWDRLVLYQKRCVANIFDCEHGRLTADKVITRAGVFEAWS